MLTDVYSNTEIYFVPLLVNCMRPLCGLIASISDGRLQMFFMLNQECHTLVVHEKQLLW